MMAITKFTRYDVKVGTYERSLPDEAQAEHTEAVFSLMIDIQATVCLRSLYDSGLETVADYLISNYHLIPRGGGAAAKAKELSEQLLLNQVVETVRF